MLEREWEGGGSDSDSEDSTPRLPVVEAGLRGGDEPGLLRSRSVRIDDAPLRDGEHEHEHEDDSGEDWMRVAAAIGAQQEGDDGDEMGFGTVEMERSVGAGEWFLASAFGCWTPAALVSVLLLNWEWRSAQALLAAFALSCMLAPILGGLMLLCVRGCASLCDLADSQQELALAISRHHNQRVAAEHAIIDQPPPPDVAIALSASMSAPAVPNSPQ
jgi:hypothetical protein